MIAGNDGIYFYSVGDQKEFYFNHKTDPLETRNKAYTIGEGKSKSNKMKKLLLEHLYKNNIEDAIEISNESLDWKRYSKKTTFIDPDEGLIYQNNPWAIDDIEGYTNIN